MHSDQIPFGIVDNRSIHDLKADELCEYPQCHFFAGIGGWPYALKLAGWPEDEPVWTGSCPCQPLSCAGRQLGEKDERHLWPEFYRVISECRPTTVFGEQVASNDGLEWLDGISLDLEELGYAVGSSDIPAASVGAPQKRQRIFWVAYSRSFTSRGIPGPKQSVGEIEKRTPDKLGGPSSFGGLGNSHIERQPRKRIHVRTRGSLKNRIKTTGAGKGFRYSWKGFWERFDLTPCLDGKVRRFEPESFPLADGVPEKLACGIYGNAIVPQVAAVFIEAFMQTIGMK